MGFDTMMVWDQDGLINTPKTFSDFFQRVLNVLLTNGLGFGIMLVRFDNKNAPRRKPRSIDVYLVIVPLRYLAFGLGYPNRHLQFQVRQVVSQMFPQQTSLPSLLI